MKIAIQGNVLGALRQNLHVDVEDAARVAGVDVATFESWEHDGGEINLSSLKNLANLFNRNWSVFLLDSPPSPVKIPSDFRTPIHAARGYSTITLKAFEQAELIADSAADFAQSASSSSFIEGSHLSVSLSVEEQAAKVRLELGISVEQQQKYKTVGKAFDAWKDALTDRGLFIAELPMDRSEVRAFTYAKNGLFVICINSNDSTNARIFSLFHELAHVLLNEVGVCDLSDASSHLSGGIEPFCNQFAASVLMPAADFISDEFLSESLTDSNIDDVVGSICKKYKVSELAAYRRLATLGFITQQQYVRVQARIFRDFERVPVKVESKGFAYPYPKTIIKNSSKGLAKAVIGAYESGQLSTTDAGRYLGADINHIPGVQKELAG